VRFVAGVARDVDDEDAARPLDDVERGDDAADAADGHGEVPRGTGGGGHLDAGGDGVSRSGNRHPRTLLRRAVTALYARGGL
jgi:hypothetical protein